MSTCGCGGDSNGPKPRHSITRYRRALPAPGRRCSPTLVAVGGELVEHRERGGPLGADRPRGCRAAPPPPRARAARERGPASGRPGRRAGAPTPVWARSASAARRRAAAGAAGSIRPPRSGTRAMPTSSGSPAGGWGSSPSTRPDRSTRTTAPSVPSRRAGAAPGAGPTRPASRSTTVIFSVVGQSGPPSPSRPTAAPRPGARPHRCRRTAARRRSSTPAAVSPPSGSRCVAPWTLTSRTARNGDWTTSHAIPITEATDDRGEQDPQPAPALGAGDRDPPVPDARVDRAPAGRVVELDELERLGRGIELEPAVQLAPASTSARSTTSVGVAVRRRSARLRRPRPRISRLCLGAPAPTSVAPGRRRVRRTAVGRRGLRPARPMAGRAAVLQRRVERSSGRVDLAVGIAAEAR